MKKNWCPWGLTLPWYRQQIHNDASCGFRFIEDICGGDVGILISVSQMMDFYLAVCAECQCEKEALERLILKHDILMTVGVISSGGQKHIAHW